ncbi:Mut7-C RNAse domain-containing protein [Sulfurimonas sp. HSL3-7]|uniref:Mut7-C RNAse domain-containing protein n=1 Tax=Sulfonitrofixus jiaomeiensis TaxID=3131938 RepID=UPI0031FA3634
MPKREENDTKMPAFIADCHLGKLAKYLRLMGFDTLYFSQIDDDDLASLALEQNRIILTRDKLLSERKNIPVLLLDSMETKAQLQTLISHYRLKEHPAPFSRCIVCNTPLQVVEKEKIRHKLPQKIQRTFSHFEYCPHCDRVYWHGDHYRRMQRFLDSVLED